MQKAHQFTNSQQRQQQQYVSIIASKLEKEMEIGNCSQKLIDSSSLQKTAVGSFAEKVATQFPMNELAVASVGDTNGT